LYDIEVVKSKEGVSKVKLRRYCGKEVRWRSNL